MCLSSQLKVHKLTVPECIEDGAKRTVFFPSYPTHVRWDLNLLNGVATAKH